MAGVAAASAIETELERLNQLIGMRLRVARKMRGLTQTQLGDLLGVTFRQVQKYENGTNRLSAASLAHLCAALDCYPVELLNGDGFTEREVLNLVLANGFEDEMIRVARLGDPQRKILKTTLGSLLDTLEGAPGRETA